MQPDLRTGCLGPDHRPSASKVGRAWLQDTREEARNSQGCFPSHPPFQKLLNTQVTSSAFTTSRTALTCRPGLVTLENSPVVHEATAAHT